MKKIILALVLSLLVIPVVIAKNINKKSSNIDDFKINEAKVCYSCSSSCWSMRTSCQSSCRNAGYPQGCFDSCTIQYNNCMRSCGSN